MPVLTRLHAGAWLALLGMGPGLAAIAPALSFPDSSGVISTRVAGSGRLDPRSPFLEVLGTNGRACVTCHEPAAGWSINSELAQARFAATDGLDPLFRPHDAAVSPAADVSTPEARRVAYRLLLTRGVIRMGLPPPLSSEFTITAVDDPYGYAGPRELSLFRRPLPAANLRFVRSVMWDGRETQPGRTLQANLSAQAVTAALVHGQPAAPPGVVTLSRIVGFETGLSTAQSLDRAAGALDSRGARGGPAALAAGPFYPGINNAFGQDPSGRRFNARAFQLFSPWFRASHETDAAAPARLTIARGERLFNSVRLAVTGVRGLNDVLRRPFIAATCTTCHDTPNVGGRSVEAYMDIGVSDAARRPADLPLYTFRNRRTGETLSVTDPGRALVSGRWRDLGAFKVPGLRGLAARAPYFHDGSAVTLDDVVQFYVDRFGLEIGPQDRADLVAFMSAL